jgi:hypothetical protein
MLWARTGAGDLSTFNKFPTASELMNLIDRHMKLKQAIIHIRKCEVEVRGLSQIGLKTTGELAAFLYLMAAGQSDVNVYRDTTGKSLPMESRLDFTLWDKAAAFWKEAANPETSLHKALHQAMVTAADMDEGAVKGRKYAIVSKAWVAYLTGSEVLHSDCSLGDDDFKTDSSKKRHLAFPFSFNPKGEGLSTDSGIDKGQKVRGESSSGSDEPDDSEKSRVEAEKAEAHKKKVDEATAKVEALRAKKAKEKAEKDTQKNGEGPPAGINAKDLSVTDGKLEAAKKKLAERKAAKEAAEKAKEEAEMEEEAAELAEMEETEEEEGVPE